MTVRIYRSTDAGAPVLNPNTVNSLNSVLQAVLVDGYGTQTAAGWTKEFDDGSGIVAFRNSTTIPESTGMYLRVDNSVAGACAAQARTYKTMTDVNTGSDPNPTLGQNSGSGSYQRLGNTSSNTVSGQIIVADERTFYMNIVLTGGNYAGGAYTNYFGAGDLESFIPGDTYNYFVLGNNTRPTNASTYGYSNLGASGQNYNPTTQYGFSVGRDSLLNPNSAQPVRCPTLGANASNVGSGYPSFMPRPNIYTGLVITHDAFICDGNGIRGKLRGVKCNTSTSSSSYNVTYTPPASDPDTTPMIEFCVLGPENISNSMFVKTDNQ